MEPRERSQESLQPMPPLSEMAEVAQIQETVEQTIVVEQVGHSAMEGGGIQEPLVVELEQDLQVELLASPERAKQDASDIGGIAVEGAFGKFKKFLKEKFPGSHKAGEDDVFVELIPAPIKKVEEKLTVELEDRSESQQPVTKEKITGGLFDDYEDWAPSEAEVQTKQEAEAAEQARLDSIVRIDISEVPSADTELSPSEAAELMAELRVAKIAPRLDAIVEDDSRDNEIRTIRRGSASTGRPSTEHDTVSVETEQEAAAEFTDFLKTYIEASKKLEESGGQPLELAERAQDMLDSLTFIGEKERTEAAKGIAEYWKTWLREDPSRQLCTIAEISSGDGVKSDRYLMDNILSNFTDEELDELGDRMLDSVEDITALPEDAKIVLVDDWTISGSQMQSQYGTLQGSPALTKYADCLEMQVVTSGKARIEEGLAMPSYNGPPVRVPIRAYFMSHDAGQPTAFADKEHNAYETGAHSSVDYDFEISYIQPMLWQIQDVRDRPELAGMDLPVVMPALTNIDRVYKQPGFTRGSLANVSRLDVRVEQRRRRQPRRVEVEKPETVLVDSSVGSDEGWL